MTDELFEIPVQLSPRLEWMRKHCVTVEFIPADPIAYDAMWMATSRTSRGIVIGTGETEDGAIVIMAKQLGIPLWNEETQPTGRPEERHQK